ncbi:retron St85 family RNA-directed DNA polymerase [Photobacterium sanguinicancri]|uniref:retron St85 family RNA-directed DNA polymerase n=1 Tax=Photobacterium sanguinicancri TaxID=875932 RepID=UPI002480C0B7|nr:retron St85 family RNA-directed DNA polymerase [Photobacterium sanguinicancri]
MHPTINLKAYLWALGVIQPAKPEEVHNFLKFMSNSSNDIYEPSAVSEAIEYSSEHQFIELVSKKNNLYVLSLTGGEFLGKQLRLLRDKNRLLLLKSLRNDNFNLEESPEQEMDGASPSSMFRSSLKEAPRPEESLSPGPLPQSQRFFWPRVSEQLRIGSNSGDSSTPIKLNYYSRNKIPNKTGAAAFDSLAELIGVSPRLLSSMAKSPAKQYRSFSMAKKSGGSRVINSPRAFIKTVQYWISDYILYRLKIHDNCFSYRKGLSIKDNARLHLNKKYVLCLDIESFFDNINRNNVVNLLINHGVDGNLSNVISYLITLNDKLPQGAPSSPIISNAYLYEFDRIMTEISIGHEVVYSRYADDLTFSCHDKSTLETIKYIAGQKLNDANLKIKESKTRILSEHNSQVVTGIAVNNGELRPSRKFRNRIRIIFYQARLNGDVGKLSILRGYLNYLTSFDNGDTYGNLEKYKSTISYLQELINSQVS